RGGMIFSISRAIAFASKIPTQIGRTESLLGSRRMMIGIWVMGSIINPLIFISISINAFPGTSTDTRESYKSRGSPRQEKAGGPPSREGLILPAVGRAGQSAGQPGQPARPRRADGPPM